MNILKIHNVKLDYAALATATGPGKFPSALPANSYPYQGRQPLCTKLTTFSDVTSLAIQKHIAKLREKADKEGVDPTAADGTPTSTPKRGPKTPTKAAGVKVATGATKTSAKKGAKRSANGNAKGSGESQETVDDEEEGLKVVNMESGKRIKLENGKFMVDEGAEEWL